MATFIPAGGSGGLGGTIGEDQVAFGDSNGEIEGSDELKFNGDQLNLSPNSTSSALLVTQTGTGNALEVRDADPDISPTIINAAGQMGIGMNPQPPYALAVGGNTKVYAQIEGTKTLVNAGSVTNPSTSFTADQNTGLFQPAADSVAITAGGTEVIRLKSAGEIGVAGDNVGTAGQVLTSGGSGSAASWTTVSGGGGASQNSLIPVSITKAGSNTKRVLNTSPLGGLYYANSNSFFDNSLRFYPVTAPIDCTVSQLSIYVGTVYGSGPYPGLAFGIYDNGNNIPTNLKFFAEFDCDSTGYETNSINIISGQDATLTGGKVYWVVYQCNDSNAGTKPQIQGTQFNGQAIGVSTGNANVAGFRVSSSNPSGATYSNNGSMAAGNANTFPSTSYGTGIDFYSTVRYNLFFIEA